jgi:hypothetical protein
MPETGATSQLAAVFAKGWIPPKTVIGKGRWYYLCDDGTQARQGCEGMSDTGSCSTLLTQPPKPGVPVAIVEADARMISVGQSAQWGGNA